MNYRRLISIGVLGAVGLMLTVPALADSAPGAQGRPRSSGVLTAGTSVVKSTRGGLVYGMTLFGGTEAATMVVYDSTSAATSGQEKWEMKWVPGQEPQTITFSSPLVTEKGIVVEIVGTGATGLVLNE